MLKITGVSKYKGSTYMIEFEEGETAFLNYEVVSAYGLRAGLDMPQSAWEKIVFDNEFRKAKERALYLLDYRDYSYVELYKKLEKNYSEEICDAVMMLTDGEDALTQVCRWYLQHTECPRQSALHRVQYRNDHVAQLVHDFKADGAIYEQMKFCTYWSYERVIANQVMPRDYGIHILSIDRPYIAGQSGQLRTRVQAFVESLEMKQLRSAQKEDN